MKKALVLGALASLGALSFGCALTDYGFNPGQSPFVGLNKSHGVIGCYSDDRFANAQQTIEAQTRNLLYTSTFGAGAGPNCPTGFDPGLTTNTISTQDAKDWNRFNGPWTFFGEAQVFSPGFDGTYMLAGVKDLADGSIRINNYYSAAVGNFTCVGAAVDGVYGGPEGVVVGDGLVNPGRTAARIPGLMIDAIAIDNQANAQFCPNLAAVSDRHATGAAFSTYWGLLGRAYEGRVHFTPVTRREGLDSFLAGSQLTTTVGGVTITGHGELNADGTVKVTLDRLENNGVVYTAGQSPLWFVVNPSNARAIQVHVDNQAELVSLANFALDSDLTGREIVLGGQMVDQLGVKLPNASFLLNTDAIQKFVNDFYAQNGDGGTGIGG